LFKTIKNIVIALLLLAVVCFISNFIWPGIAKWIGLAAAIVLLLFIVVVMVLFNRFKAFAKNGFGLNEGKVFHEWIKKTISSFHVQSDPDQPFIRNFADFSMHFMRVPPGLTVKHDDRRPNNDAPVMPMLTII